MLPLLSSVASGLLSAAALSGIAYLIAAIASVVAFSRRVGEESGGETPAVTVLKPVCGIDHGLYENLKSFCDQDYPAFQVIFGVRDTLDPSVPVIQRVIREFSGCDAVLVIDDRETGGNFKVSNLANMYREARNDIIVIADSDMRVDRNYLRMVVKPFGDPRVGGATCLYSGTPAAGLPSAMGAMFINDWFLPSVLVALALQELRFCLGATMAVRREALAAIGGFESLSPYLADDYMLGDIIARRGYTVRLCPYVVEGIVSEPDFRSLFAHELRWARTVRACRPAGYAFSIIGNGAVSLSALYLVASGFGAFGFALFVLAIGLRVVLHAAVRKTVRIPGPAAPWLIPLRDLLCLAIWIASFMGREVIWRGRRFSVRPAS
jgi:ceramide glucosyltransferase